MPDELIVNEKTTWVDGQEVSVPYYTDCLHSRLTLPKTKV